MVRTIYSFYGEDPMTSPDYARIVNERHFNRLVALMKTDGCFTAANISETIYTYPLQ